MCGVIGIIGTRPVADEIYLGMLCLQHRGQDSAGMATYDGEFHLKKGAGLVPDVFTDLTEFKGNLGIGHTRYPTVGSDVNLDAQPFTNNGIILAHNGSLTNYYELKKQFNLTSTCDAEAILRVFAQEFQDDLFHAIEKTINRLQGSYSVVAMTKDGLIAFRDPKGIRPLLMGRKGDNYIITSETCVLNSLGYEHMRNILPGEAIFIDQDLKVTSKIIKHDKRAHCMFEWVYFSRADSEIENRSVYKTRLELGRRLAKRFDKEVDVVIPVPDSGRTAAIAFAEELGVPYREGLIKNRYIGRTFIMDSQKKRDAFVNIKLNPIASSVHDLRVAVIDDSIVRSTTSKRIVKILRKAKAKEVHMVSTCPPIKHPCFYGVDFATVGELVAAKKSVEEICEHIGADSLTYANLEEINKSIRKEDLCMACLTGDYPVPVTSKDELTRNRSAERLTQNKLKIAVIGSGGREHSLVWKIAQSPLVEKIYALPGNDAMEAECVDTKNYADFVEQNKIDITIVGPEMPLAAGIVDEFEQRGLKIFGPDRSGARLEGSKIFAKEFMKRYNLPTADFATFNNYNEAVDYLKTITYPIVIKADGLAAGKGVIIAKTEEEAISALQKCMLDKAFGEAGTSVIIEEFLEGEELSYMVVLDGETCKELASSQDHKAVYDNDQGPNTGGMGAYSPAPVMKGREEEIRSKILFPLLEGLKQENIGYKGVLYIGLMDTKEGFKILEFNCRFGDPECQVLLPRMKTDFVEVIHAVVEGNLKSIDLEWSSDTCVGVVLASGGYPVKYENGKLISGLENVESLVFHAGTKKEGDNYLTNGGRVLCITTLAPTVQEAIRKCYAEVSKVNFEGMHFRTDIGKKAWKRPASAEGSND
jgi:phosphoribosylamine--glycine ligase